MTVEGEAITDSVVLGAVTRTYDAYSEAVQREELYVMVDRKSLAFLLMAAGLWVEGERR